MQPPPPCGCSGRALAAAPDDVPPRECRFSYSGVWDEVLGVDQFWTEKWFLPAVPPASTWFHSCPCTTVAVNGLASCNPLTPPSAPHWFLFRTTTVWGGRVGKEAPEAPAPKAPERAVVPKAKMVDCPGLGHRRPS